MADLPSVTDRLNDTEIAANAPLTETLMRRVGSNINFLLDFLGISDGETSPSGDLNEFIAALTLMGTHTMDAQATFTVETGVNAIGTFTTQKFVNQVFYVHYTLAAASNFTHTQSSVLVNIDGGGNKTLPEHIQADVTGTLSTHTDPRNDYSEAYLFNRNPATNERRYSKVLNPGSYLNATLPNTPQFLLPIAEIDYRDSGTNFQLLYNIPILGFPATTTIYRAYKLNAGSLGF